MAEHDEKLNDLKKQAKDLGIPVDSGVYKSKDQAWSQLEITEYELRRRIKEEERHQREHNLFWIAIISASISLISVIATLYLAFEKSMC